MTSPMFRNLSGAIPPLDLTRLGTEPVQNTPAGPTPENAHEYLILELTGHLLKSEGNLSDSEIRSYLRTVQRDLDGGIPLQSCWERHSPPLRDNYLYRYLLDLSGETDDGIFASDLRYLGQQMTRRGNRVASAILFQFLNTLPDHPRFPIQVNPGNLRESQIELDLMTGHGDRVPFNRRLEYFTSNLLTESLPGTVVQGGAWLGMASVLCSFIRPLRPLGAVGINLLSRPNIAALLLAAGGITLYQQRDMAAEAWNRLESGHYDSRIHTPWGDRLFLAGYLLSGIGIGVGGLSFALSGRTFLQRRLWAAEQGYTPRQGLQVAFTQADAVRRAVQDPWLWMEYARSAPNLSRWQRMVVGFSGYSVDRLLIGGSAVVGAGHFINEIHQSQVQNREVTFTWMLGLLSQLSLDVFPAVTVGLYRAGRGNRNFNLGPALSQELTESHYHDPALRARVLDRVDTGLHPMTPRDQLNFLEGSRKSLSEIRTSLIEAETLPAFADLHRAVPEVANPSWARLNESPEVGVLYGGEAKFPHHGIPELRRRVASWNLDQIQTAYRNGTIAPSGVLRLILSHPVLANGSVLPQPLLYGAYYRRIMRLAESSDLRFELGGGLARPLEGVFVAVKDLFPGMDGTMRVGSKTTRIAGVESSPVVDRLLELGAIPIPVGMVAAANGGSGMHAGFGYIPHPNRPGYDPAGSSSGTAHVLGLEDFPISVGIGTDTGGSVIAPAGAVGITGWVPPQGLISTKNMVPFDTYLDRVGVLANHPGDAFRMGRFLAQPISGDPHILAGDTGSFFHNSGEVPRIVYLQELLEQASPRARANFLNEMAQFHARGYEVTALGREWNWIMETPMNLYPMDAYGAAAFTFANPLKAHPLDPPRRTLDLNLQSRLTRGALSLRHGFFDEARSLSDQYRSLIRQKLGQETLLASPSPEAIRTQSILDGSGGPQLDTHDRITMIKNRIPEWGQVSLPAGENSSIGITFSGQLPYINHMFEAWSHPAHAGSGQVTPLRLPESPPVPRARLKAL